MATDKLGADAIRHAGFFSAEGSARGKVLADFVAEHGLIKSSCRVVLDSADYRMVQVSLPSVPDEEKRDALRWKVQEFIDFPVTEAEIEYFSMPSSRQAGVEGTASVLICRSALIHAYTSLCESAGLIVDVIDIPELALRNLSRRLPESERGVAVLFIDEGRSKLQVQKSDIIFLSRELDFSGEDLNGDGRGGYAMIDDDRVDRLALEIQRSLDYYESYFGNPPVAGIVVTPVPGKTQALADALNHHLGVLSRAMDINALVKGTVRLDEAVQQKCISLVGAALRGEKLS